MVNRFMTSGDPVPQGDLRAEMRLLGAVPTFDQAPAALLEAMIDLGHVIQIRPNWTILHEHTAPDKAYVLLDGEVEVRRAGAGLGRCRRGEILGELGIVRRRLRSATVVTSTRITALHLDRRIFERLEIEHSYFRDLVGEAVGRKTA